MPPKANPSTSVEELIIKRSAIKTKIERILRVIGAHAKTPVTLEYAEIAVETIAHEEQRYEAFQDSILQALTEHEDLLLQQEVIGESYDCMFMNGKVTLRKLIKDLTPQASSSSHANNSEFRNPVKLPTIELPTFDGRFEDWIPFKDLFTATVANNNALSGAQKMQYLLSSLKGEAASLIKVLQITDDNYIQAWQIIENRYENRFEIVMSLLNRLFGQPAVTTESASALRRLIDTTTECRRALENMERPVQEWDDVLVHLVMRRLDQETRRRWIMSLKDSDIPKFDEMVEFMDHYIRGLASEGTSCSSRHEPASKPNQHLNQRSNWSNKKIAAHHTATSSSCPMCKGSHPLFRCEKFLGVPVTKRISVVKDGQLCFNCMRAGHSANKCQSQHKCKKCGSGHNTLLHRDQPTSAAEAPVTVVANHSSRRAEAIQVLLATAVVDVQDSFGRNQECRVLLDGGSQGTFVSEQCTTRLGLQRTKSTVIVTGIGDSEATPARGQVEMTLVSKCEPSSLSVQAFILPKVTGTLPSVPCSPQQWTHIKGIQLADPEYHRPRPIDILLGADYVGAVTTAGKRAGVHNTPIALNTIFGWVLLGRVPTAPARQIQVNHCKVGEILQRFWQTEEMPKRKHLTAEEKKCEEHFSSTHRRSPDGRYIVQLPTSDKLEQLGDSRQIAIRRFQQVERRLIAGPARRQQYAAFMQEFLDLQHMEPVAASNGEKDPVFYLPHHYVIKESSSTTKLRVVFDGSAKSSSGISLNECLLVGPTVQDDLYTLLLRFRLHIVAVKADITKMYRQFEVADKHKDLQRIVWRFSEQEPIQDYRINRVTYGTASAPYLATRCLQQLATDEAAKFPTAAQVLSKDFYVDDLMSGQKTSEAAIQLYHQLTQLLKCGGMELCKWASSSNAVMATIPERSRDATESLTLHPDQNAGTIKALGVCWQPQQDFFTFRGLSNEPARTLTKRVMLSELAKVFDPLGLLSPVTIRAKLLYQELWKISIAWDKEIPASTQQLWQTYKDDLIEISNISIPRCITSSSAITIQLHGFSDGSESAYGASVYFRSELEDGSVMVRLITSKSRVAPLQTESVPRLELRAAVMLANLITTVKEALQFDGAIITWTDSATVLKWLAASPSRWKTFVANRVAEIQELVPSDQWHYVRTHDNPADLLTRGIPASDLRSSELWWHGPSWLSTHHFPVYVYDPNQKIVATEERAAKVLTTQIKPQLQIWNQCSNYAKVIRITAIWLRFMNNCTNTGQRRFGVVNCQELQASLLSTVRQVQRVEFSKELQQLSNQQCVSSKSKLFHLSPYLDAKGLIRVGGRLHNAKLADEVKHPLVIPHHHQFTTLLIEHFHRVHLHGGPKLLHSAIQRQFWILRARDAIRLVIRKCVVCRRHKASAAIQFMGSLPSSRVNPGSVFQQTGVDYAGPFSVRDRGRGKIIVKQYVAVFVCMATKAVHLESVSSLSTEAFLAALRRFVSRRGLVSDLFSDCGTNFVGADRELKELLKSTVFNQTISHHLSECNIQWHFNPPAAPHQGGLWEAAVKSMKFHLRRVVGATTLTSEEFSTLLCQVEACLNSRPLCSQSTNPTDLQPLTPGHFLIGRPLTAVPDSDLTATKVNRLSRWQLVQQMTQHLWQRWAAEYVTSLQQRYRWAEQHRNLQVGDLVVIKDENLPPARWAMGRIIATHPGADGLVRCATVKTATSELKRPSAKLCVLLEAQEEDSINTN